MRLKLESKIEKRFRVCVCAFDYWEPVLKKEVNEVKIATTTTVIISFIVCCPRIVVRENCDHHIEAESKLKSNSTGGRRALKWLCYCPRYKWEYCWRCILRLETT